jgi:hypothetical protein
VTRRSLFLVACATLALACGSKEPKAKPPKLRSGEIHVNVDSSGQVEVNERPMSLDSLKALLVKQKAAGKGVFYTRRPVEGAPTPEQWIVFVTVQDAGLPIRFEGDSQPVAPVKTP